MIWPLLTPSELDIADLVNGDSLIQISTPAKSPTSPFAIISKTSLYVASQKPMTIVASYTRSRESIQSYGHNKSIKTCDDNDKTKFFIVETTNNFLMVYSVTDSAYLEDPRYELLRVYNKDSDHLIQDVFPVDKTVSFFNFGWSDNDEYDNKINGAKYSEQAFEDENWHICDSRLKFRMVLKVSNKLMAYEMLPHGVLCLVTNKEASEDSEYTNVAVQIIHLKKAQNNIESYFLDEFEWFDESDFQGVSFFSYNAVWNAFYFITNNNNCWMFHSNDEDHPYNLSSTSGSCIYNLGNASSILVNEIFNIVLVVTQEDDIFYYRARPGMLSLQLTKKFKKPLNSKRLVKLKFSRKMNFIVALYSNGWCILSIYCNINFSTFDYDDSLGVVDPSKSMLNNWCTNIKDLDVYAEDSCLLVINEYGLYNFNLLKWACLDVQSDIGTKVPIMYHSSTVYIFKNTEMIEDAPQIDSSELHSCFNIVDVPLDRYILINPIKFASSSASGLGLALYGNTNLLIYSFKSLSWHLFDDAYYEFLNINCNILWWKDDYIFVDNFNTDTQRYEILMFNVRKIFDSVIHSHPDFVGQRHGDKQIMKFDSNCVLWKYDLGTDAAKFINLDSSINELVIVTYSSKLLVFKLDQKTVVKASNSENASKESNNVNHKVYRKQVLIKLIVKISLENLNTGFSLGNFNVIKVSEVSNDLLLLTNGCLYFLNLVQKNEHMVYDSYLLYNNIEFFNKVNNDSFYLFNGDDLIYMNDLNIHYEDDTKPSLVTQINDMKCLKIENFDEQFYPFAMSSIKDHYIVGLSVDIMSNNDSKVLKLLGTKKFFLHDLLNFEIEKLDDGGHTSKDSTKVPPEIDAKLVQLYNKYKDSTNFEYSLELLLYMVTTNNNENDLEGNSDYKLKLLLTLILKAKYSYLSIIAKCLRKIEVEYWDRVFRQLNITSRSLLRQCVEIKDYKTAGYYLIILLSHKSGSDKQDEVSDDDQQEIMNFLKIIVENIENEQYESGELWDMGIELIRFLKVLDGSGAILEKSIKILQGV